MRGSRILRSLAGALVVLALVACSPEGPKFKASDVTGSSFGREFSLADPSGKTRTLADFRRPSSCSSGTRNALDVCPTTLVTLAEAMKQLGPDADRVQVVFITVDPERDTPALLAEYVPAFDKRFIGSLGRRRRDGEGREGVQGHLPEAARPHAGQLYDGPLRGRVRVRPQGPAPRVREPRAGPRGVRARPARAPANRRRLTSWRKAIRRADRAGSPGPSIRRRASGRRPFPRRARARSRAPGSARASLRRAVPVRPRASTARRAPKPPRPRMPTPRRTPRTTRAPGSRSAMRAWRRRRGASASPAPTLPRCRARITSRTPSMPSRARRSFAGCAAHRRLARDGPALRVRLGGTPARDHRVRADDGRRAGRRRAAPALAHRGLDAGEPAGAHAARRARGDPPARHAAAGGLPVDRLPRPRDRASRGGALRAARSLAHRGLRVRRRPRRRQRHAPPPARRVRALARRARDGRRDGGARDRGRRARRPRRSQGPHRRDAHRGARASAGARAGALPGLPGHDRIRRRGRDRGRRDRRAGRERPRVRRARAAPAALLPGQRPPPRAAAGRVARASRIARARPRARDASTRRTR